MKQYLLLFILLLAALPAHAQRQNFDWNAGWRFFNEDAAPDVASPWL